MRRSTCFLLVMLFGSWLSSFGQHAPRFTSPRIVATFERLGQTADIPPTTIYTPQDWGTFRVSFVMVLTVANESDNGSWGPVLQFDDGSGTNYGAGELLPVTTRRTVGSQFPFRAKAGKPLKFSVLHANGTLDTKYNVWVVVEQLM